jgi:hypothetical protein
MDTAWLDGREAPGRLLERSESTVEPRPVAPKRKPTPGAGEGEMEPAGG